MVPPLTKEGYDKLCNASRRFLQEEFFGIPQIDAVMEAIFGDYTQRIASTEAQSWAIYWNALVNYEQLKRDPDGLAVQPALPLVSPGYFRTVSHSELMSWKDADFRTYGLDAPQYSHTTRLVLPKAKPSTTVVRPTPMLADLLNPVTSSDMDDSEYLFNHPDPYGMIAASNQEDGDDDGDDDDGDNAVPANPTFGIDPLHTVRHGRRLKIGELVDLENLTLLARYDDQLESGDGAKGGKGVVKPLEPAVWVKEKYSAADIVF